MKRLSVVHILRELQTRTTRYHCLPDRMAKIQNTDNIQWWQEGGATVTLIYCWWEPKMIQPLWNTVCQFLAKLNMVIPNDPATALPDIYPIELKTYVHSKTWNISSYSGFTHDCQKLEQKWCFSIGK